MAVLNTRAQYSAVYDPLWNNAINKKILKTCEVYVHAHYLVSETRRQVMCIFSIKNVNDSILNVCF